MTTIKHKRGTGDPSASDLDVGEIGINTTDGGVFTKTDGGSVVEVGASSGGGLTSDSDKNTIGGTNAGDSITAGSGLDNTLVGYNAGTDLTTADGITAFGSEAAANVTTGSGVTAIGFEACKATKDSYENTGIGYQALKNADNAGGDYTFYGSWNTAVGSFAGDAITTSYANTLIGAKAGSELTTGGFNTLIGRQAGENLTTTSKNVHIGSGAGTFTSGGDNIYIGYETPIPSGGITASGSNNIAIGRQVYLSSQTVSNEITLGNSNITKFRIPGINFTLKDNGGTPTEGHVLTVDSLGEAGFAASGVTSDAQNNTVAGTNAGVSFDGTNASNNTLFGKDAGTAITTGDDCVAIGKSALETNTTGGTNIAIGTFALKNGSAVSNAIGIGYFSGLSLTGASNVNTGVGHYSLGSATSATKNEVLGYFGLYSLTTGSNNTAIGYKAGNSGTNNLTTGSNNILIGYEATASSATISNEVTIGDSNITKFRVPGIDFILKDNGGTPTEGHILTVDANGEAGFAAASGGGLSSDAQGNTVGGTDAGNSFSGTSAIRNTLIGYNAGNTITTGDNNIVLGYKVLGYNSTAVTGSTNIGIGYFTAGNVTSGFSNVVIGHSAAGSLTEGYWNVVMGKDAFDSATTAVGNSCVGHKAGNDITTGESNTFMGYEAGDNTTTGGYNLAIGYQAKPASTTTSNSVTLGSTNINSLRCNVQTISSLSDRRDKTDINILDLGLDFVKSLNPVKFKWETRDGNGKDGSYEAGFIAQDFQQLQKENDADYLGLVMDDNPDRLEASYGKLVPILVKAIQELTIEVEKLKSNG